MHRVHWLNEDWKGGYGLGMGLYRIKDWLISGHGGGYPGYLTDFSICRARKTGVIVLTNSLGSDPQTYTKEAYKIVLPEILKAAAEAPPQSKPGMAALPWRIRKRLGAQQSRHSRREAAGH